MSATNASQSAACKCGAAAGSVCGCRDGFLPKTPLQVYNRPGLSTLAYRVGTQPLFKRSMLDALSAPVPLAGQPSDSLPMRDLKARTDDDFTIALLDSWAVVSDVMTFYQERIANESFLRTATERLSLMQLGRLVGYELRPGVAASAWLAFTLDKPATPTISGIPGLAAIPISTAAATFGARAGPTLDAPIKVQSVPAPGEQPRTFETIETVAARPEWNAIRPRLGQPHPTDVTLASITLSGLDSNLKVGDYILLVAGSKTRVAPIVQVIPHLDSQTTEVNFGAGAGSPASSPSPHVAADFTPAPGAPSSLDNDTVKALFINGKNWDQGDLQAFAVAQKWDVESLQDLVNQAASEPDGALAAYVFRGRAALFGHNAPKWASVPDALRNIKYFYRRQSDGTVAFDSIPAAYPQDWDNGNSPIAWQVTPNIDLDNIYPAVTVGSWVALTEGGPTLALKVTGVSTTTDVGYTLSAKVSRLLVNDNGANIKLRVRKTTVLLQSEPLKLGSLPINDTVSSSAIVISGAFLELKTGQNVFVTGERSDATGAIVSELATISEAILSRGFTVLRFQSALKYSYVPSSVTINANVALATDGQTRQEALGSGDAGESFQQFALKQPPLTYISGDNPSGTVSTLAVRVNDLLWHETPALFASGPDDRVFITRAQNDGTTRVQFGDGITGARLPTGKDNVTAVYRQGIGAAGSVGAGALSLLMTRPLGVKDVINPLPAGGGDDPESVDDSRSNVPLTVLTLDRVVSLQDYQDFASAFPGVGKAFATWTWDGGKRGVLVTATGPGGAPFDPQSKVGTNLIAAMQNAGDPSVPLRLVDYQPVPFTLAAAVQSDPDFLNDKVQLAVEAALRDAFSFASRDFGQVVHVSEVIAMIQNVPGVVDLNLTQLYPSGTAPGILADLVPDLPRAGANISSGGILGAQLPTLDSAPLSQLIVTPAERMT